MSKRPFSHFEQQSSVESVLWVFITDLELGERTCRLGKGGGAELD